MVSPLVASAVVCASLLVSLRCPAWVSPEGRVPRSRLLLQASSRPRDPSTDRARVLSEQISKAQTAKEVLEKVQDAMNTSIFNEVHLGVAFVALGRNYRSIFSTPFEQSIVNKLSKSAEAMLSNQLLDARTACGTFRAIAVLRKPFPRLQQQLMLPLLETIKFTKLDMTALDASNVLWGCGSFGVRRPHLQDIASICAQVATDRAEELNARSSAPMLWAVASLIAQAPDLRHIVPVLVDACVADWASLNVNNLVDALWSAARLADIAPAALALVPGLVQGLASRAQADELNGQQAKDIVWACRILQVSGATAEVLLSLVAPRVLSQTIRSASKADVMIADLEGAFDSPLFNEFHLAATFSQLGKLRSSLSPAVARGKSMSKFVRCAEEMLNADSVDATACANAFWAIATLRVTAPQLRKLIPALLQIVKFRTRELSATHVANVLWAAATLKLQSKDFDPTFASLADVIVDKAEDFSGSQIAMLIWSVASLKRDVPGLVEAVPVLVDMLEEKADTYEVDPQGLATVLWSAAVLKSDVPGFRDALPVVLQRLERGIKLLTPRDLANIVWACGTLDLQGEDTDALINATLLQARSRLPEFTCQGLASLCWGLSASKRVDVGFLKLLKARVVELAADLDDESAAIDLPSIAWSFSSLGFRSEPMLEAISQRLSSSLSSTLLNHWSLFALAEAYEDEAYQEPGRGLKLFLSQIRDEISARNLLPIKLSTTNEMGPEEWRRHRSHAHHPVADVVAAVGSG
eukprot:CAMPEP_0204152488 /NCGR_PEP_ID=MMETSP0361-20130328/27059_1 /ASSEMBLY_ACC=CAM_ASM_000343 /TAXON_ID=268821 /ORGANISM="Scrippsiella Hangoei, Strain SHTV-5" /LENGTH=753 /DNA_ID=CAMNT_0051107455 /DNA_START=70 /DNA_END=2327 /DNA_ORIENTATION=-